MDVEARERIQQLEEQLKKFADIRTVVDSIQKKPHENVSVVQNIPLPKPLNISDGDLKENFIFFQRSWERYLVASNLQDEDEEKKIAILLTAVGDDVFRRYNSLPLTEDDKSTEKKLLTALGKCFTPEVNKRYERAMFTYASQDPDESYDRYFVRLRGLIQNCQYGDLLEDLLLDKIICSIKDHSLRARLWENRKIDLETAIDICRSKEASDKQLKEIQIQSNASSNGILSDINKFQSSRRNSQQSSFSDAVVQCKYCGYSHTMNSNCPARNETCRKCNKVGHFARVCLSRRLEQVKEFQDWSDTTSDLHNTEEFVFKLSESAEKGIFANLQLLIDDENHTFQMIRCQLDTGASCNVVGLDWLCDILKNHPDIKPTTVNIKVFGGSIIQPMGEITLKVKHKRIVHSLLFQIVEYDHGPLLSSKTCEDMRLIKVCSQVSMSANREVHRFDERVCELEGTVSQEFDGDFEILGELRSTVSLERIMGGAKIVQWHLHRGRSQQPRQEKL